MAIRILTDQPPLEAPPVSSRAGVLGTLGRSLITNRKALTGVVLISFFGLVLPSLAAMKISLNLRVKVRACVR